MPGPPDPLAVQTGARRLGSTPARFSPYAGQFGGRAVDQCLSRATMLWIDTWTPKGKARTISANVSGRV